MRVLHFFKTYAPDTFGGIERVINGIAVETARHGFVSDVLSLSADPRRNSIEIDGHRAPKARLDLDIASTGLSLSALARFRHLAGQADIVHYHFPWPMADLAQMIVRPHCPTVVTYHSDVVRKGLLGRLYRPLMHRFLASADRIVATSPDYLASSDVLQRYRDKVSVIPIGIDPARYPAPSPPALAAWRDRLPDGFFFFVGVPRPYKGLDVLIDAAELAGLPLVLAGAGREEKALRRQAEGHRRGKVVFAGAVDEPEKMALVELCTALVLPSPNRAEAFGVALLEAAMRGRPMISAEIGTGTSYVNVDGQTGLVVAPGDAGALAGAMRTLWADRDRAARLGRNAAARFERLFTARQMGAAYAALYRDLLERAGRSSDRAPGRSTRG